MGLGFFLLGMRCFFAVRVRDVWVSELARRGEFRFFSGLSKP